MQSARQSALKATDKTHDSTNSAKTTSTYSNEAAATEIARHRNQLDRDSMREAYPHRSGTSRNSFEQATSQGGDRRSNEPALIAGIGFTIKGSGAERTFKIDLLGDVGFAFSAAKLFSLGSEKASAVMSAIDPAERLATTLEKRTGWKHDPSMDTRSQQEQVREAAEDRTNKYQRWAEVAYKDGGIKPGQFGSAAEAAAAYINRLTTPLIEEFNSNHPRLSPEDRSALHHTMNDALLSEKPHPDGKVGTFLKRMLQQSPNPGALENGALRDTTKAELKELLAGEYQQMRDKQG